MASSLAKETEDVSTMDNNRACSDGRCGKDKCDDGKIPVARDRISLKKPICHGYR